MTSPSARIWPGRTWAASAKSTSARQISATSRIGRTASSSGAETMSESAAPAPTNAMGAVR